MSVLLCVLFGLAVGTLATLLTPTRKRPASYLGPAVLGAVGALLGAAAGHLVGLQPATDHPALLVAAVVGAVLTLATYHAVFAPRALD